MQAPSGRSVIDRCLGAFGLELVQDARELGHLFFIEFELVSEEAKGAAAGRWGEGFSVGDGR